MGRKRKRFQDRSSVGPSRIAPYKQGEGYQARHARRMSAAMAMLPEFTQWCADAFGLKVDAKNDGHHWIITRDGTFLEWWPSSAKFVSEKKYRSGIHCHDVEQLKTLIEKRLRAKS